MKFFISCGTLLIFYSMRLDVAPSGGGYVIILTQIVFVGVHLNYTIMQYAYYTGSQTK